MEHVACDLCGGEESVVLWRKGRFDMAVRTVACRGCGLVFTDPRMTRQELEAFYSGPYRALYTGSDKPTEKFLTIARRQAVDRITDLEQLVDLGEIESAVEIGCSVGLFLLQLQQRSIDAVGFEPTSSHAAYAREQLSVDVHNEFFSADRFLPASLDLICLFHVLEHLASPRQSLAEFRELLSPEGLLYLEVPDIEQPYQGDLNDFFQNAHFYNFSLGTLTAYLDSVGFEVINTRRLVDGKFLRVLCRRGQPRGGDVVGDPVRRVQRDLRSWRWKFLIWYGPRRAVMSRARRWARRLLRK